MATSKTSKKKSTHSSPVSSPAKQRANRKRNREDERANWQLDQEVRWLKRVTNVELLNGYLVGIEHRQVGWGVGEMFPEAHRALLRDVTRNRIIELEREAP